MKFIFTIIVIIAFLGEFSYGLDKEAAVQLYMAAINSCTATAGVGEDDIGKFKKHEILESHEGKCLSACVMKSLGMMTPDNKTNKDVISAGVDVMYNDPENAKKAIEVIDECMATTDAEECEAAYKIVKCWKAASIAKGLPNAM